MTAAETWLGWLRRLVQQACHTVAVRLQRMVRRLRSLWKWRHRTECTEDADAHLKLGWVLLGVHPVSSAWRGGPSFCIFWLENRSWVFRVGAEHIYRLLSKRAVRVGFRADRAGSNQNPSTLKQPGNLPV